MLYLEAWLPSLATRFKLIATESFLRLYESTVRCLETVFVTRPDFFSIQHWPIFRIPEILVIQQFLDELGIPIISVPLISTITNVKSQFYDIIPKCSKLMPLSCFDGILTDYLAYTSRQAVILTDASRVNKNRESVFSCCPKLVLFASPSRFCSHFWSRIFRDNFSSVK